MNMKNDTPSGAGDSERLVGGGGAALVVITRLVEDPGRAGGRLAAEPQDARAHHARLPLRHVARLGAGLHLLLQRRLRHDDPRPEAPLGAGPVGP